MISCLIPAYNEEKYIKDVIEVVKTCNFVDEIIVISDGSTDKTAEIAESLEVKVIRLEKNLGKGGAIVEGLKYAQGDIILLVDADLRGLNYENLYRLVKPVLNNEVEMTIGSNIPFVANKYSGLRTVKKFIFDDKDFIKKLKNSDYNVENLLNDRIRELNLKMKYVKMKGVRNVHKIKKYGFRQGLKRTLRMYWELFYYFLKK